MKKKVVFVGLSGGVDSAVSAALLHRRGFEVVGVFIKTWHPEFLVCNEEEERRDAMRVAAYLNIPFLTFDFEDIYKKEVADYMIREYRMGRTPNPDVMCNKEVKFGAFLKKALSMGADFVATGHYAQNKNFSPSTKQMLSRGSHSTLTMANEPNIAYAAESTPLRLVRGIDPAKDQSYFLWTLRQEQLKRILFPVGNLKKTQVRKLARKLNLPVAEKKDSQGICFLGEVDLKEFLKHYIRPKRGKVLSEKGDVIGFHDGAVFYTLGERHGYTITKKNPNDGAYFVIGKDIKKNILVVSHNSKQMLSRASHSILNLPDRALVANAAESTSLNFVQIKDVNWISEIPDENKNYTAQIRYHGEFLPCKIEAEGPERSRRMIFKKRIVVASGQSCVVYDKGICLGGGIVV